jgi:regulator of protease activity HflC (stomatin/prohibitin superfamily)
MLYLKLQLAARRLVSSRTLDELLEGRELLETGLREHLAEQVAGTGLAIEEVGLKDLILPGTMRTILNQVVEAQRRAEANQS